MRSSARKLFVAAARLAVAALCIAMTGCSRQAELGGVSGSVLLDGKPLSNVQVEFVPETRGKPKVGLPMSVGVTDEAGRYELHATDGRLGAAVGEHRVVVRDLALPAGGRIGSRAEADRAATVVGRAKLSPQTRLPAAYMNSATSPLHLTVASGEQTLDLELSSSTALHSRP
jgi:hypothetical protein